MNSMLTRSGILPYHRFFNDGK